MKPLTGYLVLSALWAAAVFVVSRDHNEHQHEFQLAETWENVEIEQDTTITRNFAVSTTERGGVKFVHPKREEITIVFDGVYDNNPRMEIFICEHGEGKSNAVRYVVHARSIKQISLGNVWKNYHQ